MFDLPKLPYAYDALSPLLSEATMQTHHDKHHAAYVKKTNDLVKEHDLSGRTLEDVVRQAHEQGLKPLFNNAAQAWNHAFFWECMRPETTVPSGALAEAIDQQFGGVDKLRETFVKEGTGHFGSGWVWLLDRGGSLAVISTHDADNPLTQTDAAPLLVCDVWEHAYYLDYRNDREDFLSKWFDGLANWDFAASQYDAARGRGRPFAFPS